MGVKYYIDDSKLPCGHGYYKDMFHGLMHGD